MRMLETIEKALIKGVLADELVVLPTKGAEQEEIEEEERLIEKKLSVPQKEFLRKCTVRTEDRSLKPQAVGELAPP